MVEKKRNRIFAVMANEEGQAHIPKQGCPCFEPSSRMMSNTMGVNLLEGSVKNGDSPVQHPVDVA